MFIPSGKVCKQSRMALPWLTLASSHNQSLITSLKDCQPLFINLYKTLQVICKIIGDWTIYNIFLEFMIVFIITIIIVVILNTLIVIISIIFNKISININRIVKFSLLSLTPFVYLIVIATVTISWSVIDDLIIINSKESLTSVSY